MKYAKTDLANSVPKSGGLGLMGGEVPRTPLSVLLWIDEFLLPAAAVGVARDQVSGSWLGSSSTPLGPRGLYTGIGGIIGSCVWAPYTGGSTAVVAAEVIVPLRAAAEEILLRRGGGVVLAGSIAVMGMTIPAPSPPPPPQTRAGEYGLVFRSAQGQASRERWERCPQMVCSGDDIPPLSLSWGRGREHS